MSEPIACSLSGPDLQQRLAEIAAVGGTARRLGDELRFPADAATREQLEAIVAAEAPGCPFLIVGRRGPGDERARAIGSSDEAEPIAAELRDAFKAEGSADNVEL